MNIVSKTIFNFDGLRPEISDRTESPYKHEISPYMHEICQCIYVYILMVSKFKA